MKIFIIRHGESTSDIENLYGGDYDDHLTEKGIVQVKELAEKIANSGIEIIFSSPRIRAKETSEILQDKFESQLEIVDDLRERNAYGVLTGMEKTEAKNKFPEMVELLADYWTTVDGAETYEHLLDRTQNTFEGICNSSCDTLAIISHGGLIRCIFRDILKMGELNNLSDCSFVELDKNDSNFEIKKMEGMSF